MKKKAEENEPATHAELLRIASVTGYDVRTVARVLSGATARSRATQKSITDAWARVLRARKAAAS
jgi:hypothetical protein